MSENEDELQELRGGKCTERGVTGIYQMSAQYSPVASSDENLSGRAVYRRNRRPPRIYIRIGNANFDLSANMGDRVRMQALANGLLPSQSVRNRKSLGGWGAASEDKLAEERFGNDRLLSYQAHFPKLSYKRRYTLSSVNLRFFVSFRLAKNNCL
jgi:hypothetical protein